MLFESVFPPAHTLLASASSNSAGIVDDYYKVGRTAGWALCAAGCCKPMGARTSTREDDIKLIQYPEKDFSLRCPRGRLALINCSVYKLTPSRATRPIETGPYFDNPSTEYFLDKKNGSIESTWRDHTSYKYLSFSSLPVPFGLR